MYKRPFRPREEPSRPRERHSAGQLRQQFLQQLNPNEFDMILLNPHPPRPAKKSVQAPQPELGFVFQPMAASTPRRKANTSAPSIASTMPELIDEPEPSSEDTHRRLTMSQFIGTLPSKKHNHPLSSSTVREDRDEIAVKLPKFLHDDTNQTNDFETILVDDFTEDGDSPRISEDILRVIYGEDYNATDDLARAFEFLNDERKAVPDSPFAINDSTRCIFKDMLRRDTNDRARAERRAFKKPNVRDFHKPTRHLRKPKTGIPDYLLEQLVPQPKRRRILDGQQLRRELRHLYEFLKLLFAGSDDCDGL